MELVMVDGVWGVGTLLGRRMARALLLAGGHVEGAWRVLGVNGVSVTCV